jgi:hypothetical protein
MISSKDWVVSKNFGAFMDQIWLVFNNLLWKWNQEKWNNLEFDIIHKDLRE